MNEIKHCEVEYIRGSRTIETVCLKNANHLFHIYNYEGKHFRVFTKTLDLIQFFELGTEPEVMFLTDEEVDEFILRY